MDRLQWRRQDPSGEPPEGSDPELWQLFQGSPEAREQGLWELAEELRRQLRASSLPGPDTRFRSRLRASLVREAESRRRAPRGRLGFALGAGMGTLGVAMLAAVVVSLVVVPRASAPVTVVAGVAGQHQLPVTTAIRLSFSQPMDEAAVDRGIRIAPAVAYQASWPDPKTLLITPRDELEANVGYVVTIVRPDAVSESGAKAASTIVIPFGTSPQPATPVAQPPTLVSITPGPQLPGPGSAVGSGVGGELVLTSGSLIQLGGAALTSPSPTASASVSPSPSASATPTPTPTPSSSPSGSGGVQGEWLYALTPEPVLISSDALDAVLSPDREEVAWWSPRADGDLVLEVAAAAGGGSPQALAASAETDPGLGWLDDGDLLYSAAGQLRQVSLDGQVTTVDSQLSISSDGFFLLSPGAAQLYSDPGGVPTVYDLASGGQAPLSELVGLPTWSAGSGELAYVADGGSGETIEVSSDAGLRSRQVLAAPSGSALAGLSFDPSGSYLAYTESGVGAGPLLELADVQSQATAALGDFASVADPVWSPSGDQLTVIGSGSAGSPSQLQTLQLTGPTLTTGAAAAQQEALNTASQLAQLQVSSGMGAAAAIQALLAPGASLGQSTLLPGHFDRFYAVSSAPGPGSAYVVQLRLVRDATSSSPPTYLAETVTVVSEPDGNRVSALSQGQLTSVPNGPLVLSATLGQTSSGAAVVQIRFNSDLEPSSVGPQSITLRSGTTELQDLTFSYQPLTRTETITAPALGSGRVTLIVAPPLADVDGTTIQSPYQVVLELAPAAG